MDKSKISKVTQEVIRQDTRIHKEHSTSDEDTIFIANAFLNATKILYTQALGEEVATSLLLEVMRQSFGDESRTLH